MHEDNNAILRQPNVEFKQSDFKVNVNGSSIAVGHPWAATGGRIVTTLANEMARRDESLGLVSICAAGAMAGAMVLERE